jgi:hypothetical protein
MCLAPSIVPSLGLPIVELGSTCHTHYRQESVGHPSELGSRVLPTTDAQFSHNSRTIQNVGAKYFQFFAKCG